MPADTTPEPPGSGSAVDPWAEQARRRGVRRRRRLIRGGMVVAGFLLAAWVAVAIWALAGRSDDPDLPAATPGADVRGGDAPATGGDTGPDRTSPVDSDDPDDPDGDAVEATVEIGQDGATTVLPTAEAFVEVDEAWLLGHEDGTVDWGVIVESISDVDRGPIRIDAVFRDGSGREVAAAGGVLSGVAAGGQGVVGGTLSTVEPMPARLQVEVAVGRPLDTSAFDGEGLEVRSLDRRVRPDGSEEATGLVVSTREDSVSSLHLMLLWRDASGNVVGSVARDLDRVRPGVPAHFTVPLGDDRVPDGPPTDLLWSQIAAED